MTHHGTRAIRSPLSHARLSRRGIEQETEHFPDLPQLDCAYAPESLLQSAHRDGTNVLALRVGTHLQARPCRFDRHIGAKASARGGQRDYLNDTRCGIEDFLRCDYDDGTWKACFTPCGDSEIDQGYSPRSQLRSASSHRVSSSSSGAVSSRPI